MRNSRSHAATGFGSVGTGNWLEQQMWAVLAFVVLAATIATPALQIAVSDLAESIDDAFSSSQSVAPGAVPEGLTAAEWADIQSQIAALQATPALAPQVTVEPVVAPTQRLGRFATATFATAGATFTFDDHEVRLSTVSVGGPIAAAAPVEIADQVVYDRGPVDEWFVETRAGIEQGWTIAEAPAGVTDELVIEVAVTSELAATSESPSSVAFVDAAGDTQLRYAGLYAWDAEGTDLSAVMDVVDGRIEITVDVDGAVYPVTVDPTITQDQVIVPTGNTAQDRTGTAIDVDMNAAAGPVAVVSSPGGDLFGNDLGYVTVWRKPGASWVLEAQLQPDPTYAQVGSEFGFSVAVSDDRIAVGAPGYDDGSDINIGTVHTYEYSGSWGFSGAVFECDVAPCGGAAGALSSDPINNRFGHSIALGGDAGGGNGPVLMIGSPNAGNFAAGSVSFFRDVGGLGYRLQVLDDYLGNLGGDDIGWSVDIASDNTYVFGMPGTSSDLGNAQWGEYVAGAPGTLGFFTLFNSPSAGDRIGRAVSVGLDSDGDRMFLLGGESTRLYWAEETLVPGAGQPNGVFSTGSAATTDIGTDWFGFGNTIGSGLVQVNPWNAALNTVDSPNQFRASATGEDASILAFAGTELLVGAPGFSGTTNRLQSEEGTVFVQPLADIDGASAQTLPGTPGSGGEDFGGAVAIDGNLMAVAAKDDDNFDTDSGAVYIYERDDSSSPWQLQDVVQPEDSATQQPSDSVSDHEFGASVAVRDGRVAVGYPTYSGNRGRVRVFEEVAANDWQQLGSDIIGNGAPWGLLDRVGTSVAFGVDNNELFVGAPFASTGGVVGRTLYSGSWSSLGAVLGSSTASEQYGAAIATWTDGTALSMAVGAPRRSVSVIDSGAVDLITRATPGGALGSSNAGPITAAQVGDTFGTSVAVMGNTYAAGSAQRGLSVVIDTDTGFETTVPGRLGEVQSIAFNDDRFFTATSFSPALVRSYGLPLPDVGATSGDIIDDFDAATTGLPAVQSVAVSGDTVLVGFPNNDGAFTTDQGAVFSFTVPAPVIGENSIDIEKNWMAVGNPGDDAVFVYENTGSSWVLRQQIDGTVGSSFGASVALIDRVLVVGAPGDDGAGTDAGAAFRYGRSGSADTFTLLNEITGASQDAGDLFGFSLSNVTIGNLFIGAPGDDVDGADGGAVHAFTNSTTYQTTFRDGVAGSEFGYDVDTGTHDTAVALAVGAPGTSSDAGDFRLYTGTSAAAMSEFTIDASGKRLASPGGRYGEHVSADWLNFSRVVITASYNAEDVYLHSVFVNNSAADDFAQLTDASGPVDGLDSSGDTLVMIGDTTERFSLNGGTSAAIANSFRSDTFVTPVADYTDIAVEGNFLVAVSDANSGAFTDLSSNNVLSFVVGDGDGNARAEKLFAPEPGEADKFGRAVAVDGDTLVVGAEFAQRRDAATGEVHVFKHDGTDWVHEQELLPPAARETRDAWGRDVAIAGDTIAILGGNGGANHIVSWATRPNASAPFTISSNAFRDVVAGAIDTDGQTLVTVRGIEASIFTGGPAAWAGATELTVDSLTDGRDIAVQGNTIAISETPNGTQTSPASNHGTVRLYQVSPFTGLPSDTIVGDRTGTIWSDGFGQSIDLDTDGSTLIVGAPFDLDRAGQVYIFEDCDTTCVPAYTGGSDAGGESGHTVAIAGGRALFSSRLSGTASLSGASDLLAVDSLGTWSATTHRYDAPDADGVDQYIFVALSSDWVVVGAGDEDQAGANAGAVIAWPTPPDQKVVPTTRIGTSQANQPPQPNPYSVDISGDTMVLGWPLSNNGSGSADVFTRGAGGEWTYQQTLTPGFSTGANFGTDVAIEGDTIVLGGPFHVGASNGGVSIWSRSGNVWSDEVGIAAVSIAGTGGYLGWSVDIAGGVIVAGAPANTANSGGVMVITGGNGSWAFDDFYDPGTPTPGNWIGWDVAIDDSGTNVVAGSQVGVLEQFLVGSGWDQTLTTGTTDPVEYVGVNGGRIAGMTDQGAASVWTLAGASLSGVTYTPANAIDHPSMDFDGTYLVIGDPGVLARSGQVQIYTYNGSTWVPGSATPSFDAPDAALNAYFGERVVLDDGTLVVLAEEDDNSRGNNVGSLYVTAITPAVVDAPNLTFDLALGAGQANTVPVTSSLSLAAIDSALIAAASADNSTLVSANLGQTEIQNSPLSSLDFGDTPIPDAILNNPDLADIPLIDIRLDTPGGWTSILAGTVFDQRPLQDVTLGEVLAYIPPPTNPKDPAGEIRSLPLSSLDVNGTPLSSLPLSSLVLGSLPLSSLQADFAAQGVNVCAELQPFLPGLNCAQIGALSLTEASLRGAPLSSLPLSSLPLSSLPLSSLPLSSLPLSSLDLAESPLSSLPLSSLPLSSLDVSNTPLSSLPLSSLPLSSLPLSSLPLSSLPLSSLDVSGTPLSSLPLSSLPLSSLPLSSLPLSSLPLSSLPLSSLDVNGAPLSSLPLSSLPLSSLALSNTPLSSLPLSSLNPNFCADVDTALGGQYTCAEVEAMTVYEATLIGAPLSSLPLSSLPLSSLNLAGTPLSSLPLSSLPLSSLPLSSLPLSSLELDNTPLSSLPLSSLGPVAAPLSSLPLSSLDVAGTPLSSLPLSSLPLSSLPLSSLPLSSLPLSSLPLSSLPLSSLDVNGSPLSSLPLSSLDVVDSPLSSLPLSSLPLSSLDPSGTPLSSLVDCNLVDCDVATFGDAFLAGAFDAANVTLLDVQPYLAGIRLGELVASLLTVTDVDLQASIDATVLTLGDLLGLDDLTLGDLPLDDPIVAGLTLGDLEEALWIVSYADLLGAVIDPATGQPFSDTDVQAALDAAIAAVNATLADLEYWGDTTLGDILIGTGGNSVLDAITMEDLGPWVGFIDIQAMIDEAGMTNPSSQITELLGDLSDEELGTLTLGDLIGLFGLLEVGEWLTELELNGNLDGFTLADLLAALVGLEDIAFGGVDFTDVETGALPENTVPPVTFRAGFQVTDTTIDKAVVVAVELPATATYLPGSATINDGGGAVPLEPTITGNTAEWEIFGVAPTTPHLIEFEVLPEVTLGSTSLTGAGRIVGTDVAVFGDASVTVNEGLEPNDTLDDATLVTADTVYLTYISSTNDRDLFRIDVNDRDRLAIQLSNLTADLDLVVYADPTDPSVGSALTGTSDQAPLIPITDPDGTATSIEVPANVPRVDQFDARVELLEFANAAGTADELIVTEPLPAGTYYVQVHGADGARNQEPATLQIQTLDADSRPDCSTLVDIVGSLPAAAPGLAPAADPSANTIFLVNEQRMEQLYGATGRADVMNSLQALVLYLEANPSLGLDPMVIPVETDAAVVAAYAAWDDPINPEDACDPEVANDVVGEIISSHIAPIRDQIEHLIVVGSDDVIPMARLKDATSVANEYDYRTEFADDLNGSDPGNVSSLGATFWESRFLSDDPYGESSARSLGDRFLYVPDYAVGRLVETPTEIASALDHFVFFDGTLDMNTAAVLGYDFLTDQTADQVDTLTDAGLSVDGDLADGIDDTQGDGPWDRQDAIDKLVPPGGGDAADLIAFNAHFDHYRALPAAGDKVPGFDDNVETSALLAAIPTEVLKGSVLFSAGCHSGLSVSDIQIGQTNLDWAQASAQNGASYIGNTGFGYGDTETIAYTERLLTIFTDEVVSPLQLPGAFAPTTIGQAFSTAKNRFVAESTTISVYDEKAVMQATFYGLPFYRVDLAAEAAPPVPDNEPAPDQTGSDALVVPVDAGNQPIATPLGTYYANTNDDGSEDIISVPGRPVQPKTSTDVSVVDPADPDVLTEIAHGGLIIDMTSEYVSLADPVITSVIVEESVDVEEPPIPNVAFPINPIQITESNTAIGERQTMSIATGQYKPGPGIQRLDDDIAVVVYYADRANTDFNAPRIRDIDTSVNSTGLLTVTLRAADDNPIEGVDRVFVLLAQNPGAGQTINWDGFDLGQVGSGDTWTGSLQLDTGTTAVELLVQAKDGAGNVSYATDKGGEFVEETPAPPAPEPVDLDVVVDNTNLDPSGVYTAPVDITVTAEDDLAEYTVDGGPAQPVPAGGVITFGVDGQHQIVVTTPQGEVETIDLLLDTAGLAPVVESVLPANGGSYEPSSSLRYNFGCNDPSLESCTPLLSGVGEIDNGDELPSTPGNYTLTITAVDELNNSTVETYNFTIVAPLVVDVDDANLDVVSGWHDGPVTISATAGLPITYTIDGGSPQSLSSGASFTITDSGTTVVEVFAGTADEYIEVRVDNDGAPDVTPVTPTVGQVVPVGHSLTYDWSCSDVSPFGCTGSVGGVTVSIGDPLPAAAGSYLLEITGTDIVGNTVTEQVAFTVDQALVVDVDDTDQDPVSQWFDAPVEITVTGGGRGPLRYSVDGAPFQPIGNGGSFFVTGDGTHTYVVEDDVDSINGVIEIDTTGAPTVTITTPVDGASYAFDGGEVYAFDCADVSPTTCEGLLDGTTPVADGDPLPATPGTYTLEVTGTDAVGDSATESVTFTMANSLDVQIDQTFFDTPSGWYSAAVEVTATAASAVTYTLDGGTPQPVGMSGTFVVPGDGIRNIVISTAGGETFPLTLQIDSSPAPTLVEGTPTTGASYPATNTLIYSFSCDDGPVPVTCEGSVGGNPVTSGVTPLPTAGGSYVLEIVATDVIGRTATYNVPFEITVPLGVVVDNSNLSNGWYDGSVDLTVTGTGALSYTVDGGGSTPLVDGETFTVTGNGSVDVTVTDGSTTQNFSFDIDGDGAPVFTSTTPVAGGTYAFDAGETVAFTCTDVSLVSCDVTIDGNPVVLGAALPTTAGTHTLAVTAVDAVGNTFTDSFTFDVTLSLDVQVDQADFVVGSGWYSAAVEITATAVSEVFFSIDGAGPVSLGIGGGTFMVPGDGAIDVDITTAGGESFSDTLLIDSNGAPVITTNVPTSGASYPFNSGLFYDFDCTDVSPTSCVATVGGVPVTLGDPLPTAGGSYVLQIVATDAVNDSDTVTVPFEITVPLGVVVDDSNEDPGTGWYDGSVDLTVTGSGSLSYTIGTGAPVALVDGETFTVTGDGPVAVSVTDGSATQNFSFDIDGDGDPVIIETVPTDGGSYAFDAGELYAFDCTDTSLVSCDASVGSNPVVAGDPLPATPGSYVLDIVATDSVGNVTNLSVPFTITLSLNVVVDPANLAGNGSGWYTGNVEITVNAASAITFSLDGGVTQTPIASGSSFFVTAEGATMVVVQTSGETFTDTIEIDATGAPVFTPITPTDGQIVDAAVGGVYAWTCTDTSTATCDGSAGGTPVTSGVTPLPTTPGNYTLEIAASDTVGNTASYSVDFEVVELLDVSVDQTNFDAVADWYSAPVDITVNGSRPLEYTIDGGTPVALVDGETFTVPGDGTFLVSITDGVDTIDVTLSIDATPGPVFTEISPTDGAVIPNDSALTYDWLCEDAAPFTCEGSVGGAPVSEGDALPTTPGSYTLEVTGTDVFGTATVNTVDFTIVEALVVDVDATNLAGNGSGWYTGDVDITVAGGAAISYTLDGVGPTPILDGESFTITGEGLHTFLVETDAGEMIGGVVEIDSINPTFTEISPTPLTQYPAGGGDTYDWLCADDNLVSCEGTVNGVPVSIGGSFPTAAGGYTLTVTSVDVAGNDTVSNVYFEIVVVGVSEPEIVTINGPAVPIGDAVVLDIEFGDDDGAADVYTIDVDWGDSDDDDPLTLATTCTASTGAPATGNPACEIVSAPTAPGETDGLMSATFAYAEAGVYTVTVTITDAAGNTDTSLFEFAVVYDPTINGRVAGAGWYWSGAEAYAEEEPWGGPAFFGYRARYKNDETLKGKTRLHLLGEFFFKSTSYDYLIINDTMAIAEGVGKINGDTGYRFRVQGIDNGWYDFFQISIWDEATGEVIYDNGILYDEGDLVLLGGIRVKE